MGTPETSPEPCPDRIMEDMGGAFGMGAVGGSTFYFFKGIYNSPKGHHFVEGTQAVRMNAPRVGSSLAVWGGLFSTFDCTMVYVRQKEDPWNFIFAGAATGGFFQMRQGLGAASLALIEGAGIMLNKVMSAQQNMPILIEEPAPNMAGGFQLPNGGPQPNSASSISGSSWFGGWFGGEKKDESKVSGGVKTEFLESFDSPTPPSFEFK